MCTAAGKGEWGSPSLPQPSSRKHGSGRRLLNIRTGQEVVSAQRSQASRSGGLWFEVLCLSSVLELSPVISVLPVPLSLPFQRTHSSPEDWLQSVSVVPGDCYCFLGTT